MGLAFDTSRRPRRPTEWNELLEAVYGANAADESHALEWKGPLDLTDRQEVARSIAREILAMANRAVAVAAEHFNGHGILIVGVEPGLVHRIAVLDAADLDPKVTQFLGADGPAWEMKYVRFRGEECLVIDVAPPAVGDRIFALRKPIPATEKFRTAYAEGAVFVRHQATTVQAVQADFDVLLRRGQETVAPLRLDLEVSCAPATASTFLWDETNVRNWLDGQRNRLMQSVKDAARKREAEERAANLARAARSAGFGETFRIADAAETLRKSLVRQVDEHRSEAQFAAEVEEWIGALRNDLATMPRRLGAALAVRPVVRVRNRTRVNYRQVEVHLQMAGEAEAYEAESEMPELRDVLQDPPRPFGPYAEERMVGPFIRGQDLAMIPPPNGPRTRPNHGSFTVQTPPLDLRPHQIEVIEEDTVFLVPTSRIDPLVLSWTATATNIDGVETGQIALSMGEPLDLFSAFLNLCEEQRWPYRPSIRG